MRFLLVRGRLGESRKDPSTYIGLGKGVYSCLKTALEGVYGAIVLRVQTLWQMGLATLGQVQGSQRVQQHPMS